MCPPTWRYGRRVGETKNSAVKGYLGTTTDESHYLAITLPTINCMLRQLILGIALSFLGIFFALLGVEVLVRVLLWKQGTRAPWSDRPSYYFAKEGGRSLQDYSYAVPKSAETFRIAVVGDSFSFAPYMQFTDTFPKKLEVMINLNQVPLRGEVINYGVPAYSSSHEVSVVEQALKEQADLVLLQITLNDPELKPYRPTGIRKDIPDKFAPFNPTGAKAKLYSMWRTAGYVAERLHNTATHRAYRNYFYGLFDHPKGYRVYRESLERMRSLCKDANIPFVAVVFPLFGVPFDESYPFLSLHERLRFH